MYRVSREGRRAGAGNGTETLPKGYKRLAGAVNPYQYKSTHIAKRAMRKLSTADPRVKTGLKIAGVLVMLLMVRSVRITGFVVLYSLLPMRREILRASSNVLRDCFFAAYLLVQRGKNMYSVYCLFTCRDLPSCYRQHSFSSSTSIIVSYDSSVFIQYSDTVITVQVVPQQYLE